MDDPALLTALAASALSCYFAACSIALKTFSRPRLAELLESRGASHRLEPFLGRLKMLSIMVGTLRTSLNLVVLLAVLNYIERAYELWAKPAQYLVAFALAGALVSVFSVAVPISLAHYHPEHLLARTMRPLMVFMWIFQPAARFLQVFDPIVRRITGAQVRLNGDQELTDEVLSVVEEHEALAGVDESQKEMLEAVLEFGSTTAGEIMTPRTDVRGIEAGATLDEVRVTILEVGHSRIPVFRESLDHIVGILYAKDLIRLIGDPDAAGFDWRTLLRDPVMVPESKPVRELLAEFRTEKVHIAIVLDEYGGTAGLVTIEDILEELVGEIHDEYEPGEDQPVIQRVDDHTTLVDARLSVHDLNDELDLNLPEDQDYDTVGGFVFSTLGHIPVKGETFDFDNLRMTVTDAEKTKVKRVRIQTLSATSGR